MIIDISPIENHLRNSINQIIANKPCVPRLDCILSDKPEDISFLKSIQKQACLNKIKVNSHYVESNNIQTWKYTIKQLNDLTDCNGILLISPPLQLRNPQLLINDNKNVEGNDFDDRKERVSCTARACVAIIKHILHNALAGVNVAILGFGKAVGKPLSYLLMREHIGSVILLHKYSHLDYIKKSLLESDIIISATGNSNILSNIVDPHQLANKIIIDAGISITNNKVKGDVNVEYHKNNLVTPVPGGVGVITTLLILENTAKFATNNIYQHS